MRSKKIGEGIAKSNTINQSKKFTLEIITPDHNKTSLTVKGTLFGLIIDIADIRSELKTSREENKSTQKSIAKLRTDIRTIIKEEMIRQFGGVE